MSARSRFVTWWKAVFHSSALDRQIGEELQFHVESSAEDLNRSGMSHQEARRRARAELVSLAAGRENCRTAWGTRLFDELGGDLRYALRELAKSPGFAAIAIGSLTLGIGANAAIFSAGKQLLYDQLDVPHADQLCRMEWTGDSRAAVQSFLDSVARNTTGIILGTARQVQAVMVSGNYYTALDVRPQLGRPIEALDDAEPGAGAVAIISDDLWERDFGRSLSVLGQTITLNQTPLTIVGVNPPGFTGTTSVQRSPDIFVPLAMQPKVYSLGGSTSQFQIRIFGGCRLWAASSLARTARPPEQRLTSYWRRPCARPCRFRRSTPCHA